jgi:Tfp pilus assembly protein FimT
MRKNKGFTYYELLVVIAIMSLMVGFTSIGIGTVYRNNVHRWADKIESSAKQARNNALSKGNSQGYLNLYYKDKKLYTYVGEQATSVDFSTQNWECIATNVDEATISWDTDAGHISLVLPSGVLANVGFKQSTGEVSGLVFPYASLTKYPSDITIRMYKGHKSSTVEISRYGSISVE